MQRLNRSQRVLIAAFAISLILHFLFAFLYRIPLPRRSSEVETVTILRRSMAIVVRTPQPPPPATPKPHPRPQPSAPKATPAAQGFAPGNGGSAVLDSVFLTPAHAPARGLRTLRAGASRGALCAGAYQWIELVRH